MRPTFPDLGDGRDRRRWEKEVERRLHALESSGPLRNASIPDGVLRVLDASQNPRVRLGKLPDGSFGLDILDAAGTAVTAETLGFAPSGQIVADAEERQSTSYGDLATVGPTVSFDVGERGILIGIMGAICGGFESLGGFMSYQLSGANALSPNNARAVYAPASDGEHRTWGIVRTGLAAGTTTIRAKYRDSFATDPIEWSQRFIMAWTF